MNHSGAAAGIYWWGLQKRNWPLSGEQLDAESMHDAVFAANKPSEDGRAKVAYYSQRVATCDPPLLS